VVIGIAILKYRLFDIQLVLSRTLTYGALTVGVVGTYALVLWGANQVFDNRSAAGLLGVGLVAVAVQPAHAFLRRRVERWVYGDRSDPTGALRRLSDRVEQTADPGLVVQTVTESVAEALRVDRVWVELVRDEARPQPGDQVVRVPLTHRGERLGDLAVEVPAGRQLAAPDLALLNDLARHASVVVNAVHLTLDLQRSRARLVTTREEERRRLRRDLHDGLGPSLAAIVLKLNAAQSRTDSDERNRLLTEAREETRAAITEVRRLVDDLRPPAIDEVGLLGAIRQRAASLSNPDLLIEVSGPAALPPLPAAVEVAAFRIATEAVTNVSRHAEASHCVVHLAVNGAFELSVSDNGRGPDLGTNPGVGWTSMAERAAELGGSCTISRRTDGGGTVVRAVLPLPSSTTSEVVPT
jgi:signal transduction histidine kinase